MKMLKTIEDINTLSDHETQLILREIEMEDLAVALKGVSPQLIEKIYFNMSENAVNLTKKRIEETGPVALKKVEAVHAKIVEAGNLVLKGNE